VERHVVEGGYGEDDARVAWDMSARVKVGGKRNEPIKFGMKRKMFSLGWSLATLAGCTAAPLPFARFRTADIAKEKVACCESCLGAVSQSHSELVGLQVPRCRGVV
jgi:hypothetical protein